MENTSPILFDNEDEKYFLALQGRAVGPLTAQEVYERIQRGEVQLLHFIWQEGWADWKRVCDEKEFAVLIPQKPSSGSIDQIKKKMAAKKSAASAPPSLPDDSKVYYLYYSSTQYGPFSQQELVHVLESHKVTGMAYLWTPGWANWKRLSEIEEYARYVKSEPKSSKSEKTGKTGKTKKDKTKTLSKTLKSKEDSDRRGAPRRPLVARLFLHNNEDVIIAVCRDISIGGMQVLTDRIPGPVGSTIKLNVSPGDPTKVKGFVAEGEIVRVLEDGRGFSFRFKKVSDEAKRAIQKYIEAD